MKIHLLVIDPQNDFCDPKGSLFVPGANEDMQRLSAMLNRLGSKIDDIHVTLDSHHLIDIAHPLFWKGIDGNHPNPFTIISVDSVKNGTWTPSIPSLFKRSLSYVESLEKNGRYPLCIWPPHCLIGSEGYGVFPEFYRSLLEWETKYFGVVNFVTKGSNIFTEHYSAVKADVPDPNDITTQINTGLIEILMNADEIIVAGEASSHCVYNTVKDIIEAFGDDSYVKKMVILKDAMSAVPGFEAQGNELFNLVSSKGARITTTVEYLK